MEKCGKRTGSLTESVEEPEYKDVCTVLNNVEIWRS
jgi:hypothetical protein